LKEIYDHFTVRIDIFVLFDATLTLAYFLSRETLLRALNILPVFEEAKNQTLWIIHNQFQI